jgi:hypothetical protein
VVFPLELQVKQYVAQIITKRGQAFRVFETGDAKFYLFDPLDQPDGCSMCNQFPVRKSELRTEIRRGLRHGWGCDLRQTRRRDGLSRYAESTSVPSDKSRSEIERTLTRYGADQFIYGWGDDQAIVGFRMKGRQIKFVLPMPNRAAREFWITPARGTQRSEEQAAAAHEQAVRQRWRALALVIKAKLEAVESGIVEFDDEFLAHIVLPDGQTFGQWAKPQIESAYRSGEMPALLPYCGDAS